MTRHPLARLFPLRALSATVVRSDRQPVLSPVDFSLDEEPALEVGVRHEKETS